MNGKQNKLKSLFDHLYVPDKLEDMNDVREELKLNGIDPARVLARVSELLKTPVPAKSSKPAWLDSAREKRSKIEQQFKVRSEELRKRFRSPRELVAAIRSGDFGAAYQARASAFFRNQDFKTLSDEDLISFIEDCELLESLKKDGDSE